MLAGLLEYILTGYVSWVVAAYTAWFLDIFWSNMIHIVGAVSIIGSAYYNTPVTYGKL